MSDELTCARARAEVRAALQSGEPVVELPPTLREHVAGCPVCRAALLLIDTIDLAELPEPIACARCQEELPAYIEHELEHGTTTALRARPQVWWHLWTCAECLEAYELIRALVGAERRGELAVPRPARPDAAPPMVVRLARLTRRFLREALPAPQALQPVARGGDEGPMVISEGQSEVGPRFVLSVERQHNQLWTVAIAVTPAPAGWLRLTLGEQIFRVPFDGAGSAMVADVPDSLLTSPDGPELLVDIEADEG